MLRPRDGIGIQTHSFEVTASPNASVSWAQDVFGNTVGTAVFQDFANTLEVIAVSEVVIDKPTWPVFDIIADAILYPFAYSRDDLTDLGELSTPQYPTDKQQVLDWALVFLHRHKANETLSILKDICWFIGDEFIYEYRVDEGTQTPTQTLNRRTGSCRDLAVLYAEAVRSLGFGARLVSGYLYDPDQSLLGSNGLGSTHAWVEVFIPGAGWIAYDPTNRRVGGYNLIPVAVVRDIRSAPPVAGNFIGNRSEFLELSLEVSVEAKLSDAS